MSKRTLPQLTADQSRDGSDFEITPAALQRWNPAIRAQAEDAEATISIYGVIGATWDGSGITAGRIAGALRNIGDKDVVVNINSPGGSVFEGVAIYNLLRAHPHNVTVRVLGQAASIASIIAMSGDTVQVGRAAFLMIHNSMVLAIGNRHDMRSMADTLEPIDRAMSEVYSAKTGMKSAEIMKLMDKETWFGGDQAVEQGFADELLPADQITEDAEASATSAAVIARAEIHTALAKAGYSRSQRRELLKEFSGTPSAAANATPSAGGNAPQIMPSADPAEPAAAKPQPTVEEPIMTLEELKAKHPDLFKAIRDEGVQAGATAERQRIKDVEAQALPGHADLITALKFDGKTTGGEAAMQVNAAERAKLGKKATDILADAGAAAAAAATAAEAGVDPVPAADDDKSKPVEERCKAKWDSDASIRAEFTDLQAYTAMIKAEESGRVRVLGARKAG